MSMDLLKKKGRKLKKKDKIFIFLKKIIFILLDFDFFYIMINNVI